MVINGDNTLLRGVTYDFAPVMPADDSINFKHNQSYIEHVAGLNDLALSVVGLTLTVDTGMFFVKGRQTYHTTSEAFTVPASGTYYLVARLDLTQQNTPSGTPGTPTYSYINNQVSLIVTDTTEGPTDFIIATLTTSASAITLSNQARVHNFVDWVSIGTNVLIKHSDVEEAVVRLTGTITGGTGFNQLSTGVPVPYRTTSAGSYTSGVSTVSGGLPQASAAYLNNAGNLTMAAGGSVNLIAPIQMFKFSLL
jgi:hypothetical protein